MSSMVVMLFYSSAQTDHQLTASSSVWHKDHRWYGEDNSVGLFHSLLCTIVKTDLCLKNSRVVVGTHSPGKCAVKPNAYWVDVDWAEPDPGTIRGDRNVVCRKLYPRT